jgi:hypothetical protein
MIQPREQGISGRLARPLRYIAQQNEVQMASPDSYLSQYSGTCSASATAFQVPDIDNKEFTTTALNFGLTGEHIII